MKIEHLGLANRILMGSLFLVAGLLKIFVMKPAAIEGMLAGIGFPAAIVFAWILIIFEVVCGAAILFNWQVKWAGWPLIIILLVATFTSWWANVPQMLVHLVVVSNLLLLMYEG